MASTSNKLFHTYENAVYDDQAVSASATNNHYAPQPSLQSMAPPATALVVSPSSTSTLTTSMGTNNTGIAVNRSSVESPFPDPLNDPLSSSSIPTTTILSTTDSSGNTRKLTSRAVPGQNLVTKLIAFPAQSPMDSFKEWSVSTFKCTKQIINEKRGICSVTNDAQLQADIDQLRDSKNKLVQMLRTSQQMLAHYNQLVGSQRQLHSLMSEMSIKNFATISTSSSLNTINNNNGNNNHKSTLKGSKHIVANFSSLGNNLTSATTNSPTHRTTTAPSSSSTIEHHLDEFMPILNHMRSSHLNLTEDFKKNSFSLNAAIKNGEKLVMALNFFCSNLSTLINKTIEDTLTTVKQFEVARLEYDAERNSLNFTSPTSNAQTSITTYSSDKLELSRIRYEQLKEDVQIKMKFLEENTIKVMHKQLLLFNGAFASYSSGNTAALDATLKQFSIR